MKRQRTYSRKNIEPTQEVVEQRSLSPPPTATVWYRKTSTRHEEVKKPKKSPKEKVAVPEQTFLDLRKNALGVEVCSICQMRYSKGVGIDEALHKQHCQMFRKGVKWPKDSVFAETVQNYTDGCRVVKVESVNDVRSDSVIKKVLQVVDTELGFVDCDNEPPGDGKEKTAYLVISPTLHVVGCCVTVPVVQAFRVIPEEEAENGTWEEKEDIPQDHNTVCSSEAEKAKIGISRIWVHRDWRRKRFATRLLDCIAAQGYTKEDIAFSQPTQYGRMLATKWFERKDFLVFRT